MESSIYQQSIIESTNQVLQNAPTNNYVDFESTSNKLLVEYIPGVVPPPQRVVHNQDDGHIDVQIALYKYCEFCVLVIH